MMDKPNSSAVQTLWVGDMGTVQLAIWLRHMTVPVWWQRQPRTFMSRGYPGAIFTLLLPFWVMQNMETSEVSLSYAVPILLHNISTSC